MATTSARVRKLLKAEAKANAPRVTVDNAGAAEIAANLQQVVFQMAEQQQQTMQALGALVGQCEQTLQACSKAMEAIADKSVSVDVAPAEVSLTANQAVEYRMTPDGDGFVVEVIRE